MHAYNLNYNLHFDKQVSLLTNKISNEMKTGLIKEENLYKRAHEMSHEIFCNGRCTGNDIRNLFL
jgi:hypothetical protein